ncbi:aminoacyl-tRNA hydrolase [Parvibium lacunae]|uniref:Peptidyl-tRNA hydrolase n=1 Tax=Parvibium lacunae TaxID=1888893 RepID=A0A368L087_9BURK|nr:aminoacyl-tRNA hydrolase [Parvibium lacunae]RCS56973.1 aminoacyl-tRNA hydrolase [Parvibium lacunae]
MSTIQLIVGLGNPGSDYEATRHNAGFWFVDALAREAKVNLQKESRFHGLAAKARLHGKEVWLLQPHTFMNRSGQSVGALARFFKITPEQILVAHDELDLPPGDIRLKKGGGAAGHNGLKDIQANLSAPDYWRLRVGIGHPRSLGMAQPVADFVLHKPGSEHLRLIEDALMAAQRALPLLLQGDSAAAMRQLHSPER